MWCARFRLLFAVVILPWMAPAKAEDSGKWVIEPLMMHLRAGDSPEWSSFPEHSEFGQLDRRFQADSNTACWTLTLRQQDVKQSWNVELNGKKLGKLVRDENDLISDFVVPTGTLVEGENHLEISCGGQDVDDIRVGQIELHAIESSEMRNACTIDVALTNQHDQAVPGRITIVDSRGTLVPVGRESVGRESGDQLAIREGVVYTSTGHARFGVAAGTYQIIASRGFEYSVASTRVHLESGEHAKRTLQLQREVDTRGWVACDTHIHTVTHSGHGDCSLEERMVTLVGEGIELPIATDHNKHIDYEAAAQAAGVRSRFTPVIGNEVTTKQGHFNVFPVRSGSETPDHTQVDWGPLMSDIFSTPDVRVAILNHARDLHSGFRPFSPRHHVSLVGENLDGRPMKFNAMELINSGAVQTDPMELFHDWCGLVNRGLDITPVGSSDSHDVSRYIVGQGRTYIQCDDSDVGDIDVASAVDAFLGGRVVVSYGLFTRLRVGEAHGPGDLVNLPEVDEEIMVQVEVLGPSWTSVEAVELYVCGQKIITEPIESNSSSDTSIKTSATWRFPRGQWNHDVWMTAVARGPGIAEPFWPTAKPYQPDSTEFQSSLFSSTGPVRIDVDQDGKFTTPYRYARRLTEDDELALADLAARLEGFHPSVAHQVASLLNAGSVDLEQFQDVASGAVSRAIADYRRAYRASTNAQLEQAE